MKRMKHKKTDQRGIKKKLLRRAGILLVCVFCAVLCYFAYVILSYKRLPDRLELKVEPPLAGSGSSVVSGPQRGKEYGIITYNIGFGAYTPDFSFFMDGGKSSVAESRESVVESVSGAAGHVLARAPDFALIQEMDIDGTRSHHVNQYEIFNEKLREYHKVFAQNYDSAFLFYPPLRPHGKNRSGISTYSRYPIRSALRRSFPISSSFSKFLDLDRCYSLSRIEAGEGRELVIFNVHMSAYGHSDEIREAQVSMLLGDMEEEYEKGNYVICGGDFNHELRFGEGRKEAQETQSWAHPFPKGRLSDHFYFAIDSLSEEEREGLFPSSRNADIPYSPDKSQLNTLDGFLLSDNVECRLYRTIETGFMYSDHEAVEMRFRLK